MTAIQEPQRNEIGRGRKEIQLSFQPFFLLHSPFLRRCTIDFFSLPPPWIVGNQIKSGMGKEKEGGKVTWNV